MTGYIYNIWENDYALECGIISGDDGNTYYFDSRSLEKDRKMIDCDIEDEVEFTPIPPVRPKKRGIAKNVILNKYKGLEEDEKKEVVLKESNVELIHYEKEDSIIVKYFTPGFTKHLDKEYAYKQFLKKDSGEDVVIEKLSNILYISRIGNHVIDQRSRYEFCMAGATEILKQYIRGKYEFLIIMSHFDNEDWQQKNLIVEREIRKRREIADRRPLVNFYVLISNASNLKEEIEKVKGGTSAAVIPFSFDELINCDECALADLFISRFGEYMYENNMLGETNAIDDDNLLFGDRGKIADSIVNRCENGSNSGIFGLRRSGKTSVLNAVMRRLQRNEIKYVKIESRSELESLDSWKTALFDIAKKIRQITLGVYQEDGESRTEFIKRLKLNSTEEDYKKRPSYFIEDVKLYCKEESVFVIAIDEVELITYNTAKTQAWKNIEAYCGFWGALRDCGCPLIVCGVNSTINEGNNISYNGVQGDNPMYGRINNCTEFSSTYLPAFSDQQTKRMINTLGGYSNIAFSNVYVEINRAFGGQPYAIRQFCSYVFEKVKHLRKPNEMYEISKASVENLLQEFSNSAQGNGLCEVILQHLTIFKEEYEMLKKIALAPDRYRTIHGTDIRKIDHLQKYGLIEYDYNTHYISFGIHIIKEYICKTSIKNPRDMTNDERRQYIQTSVAECEKKLKTYIREYYIFHNRENTCRNILIGYINHPQKNKIVEINKKALPISDPNTCAFHDFFDHKKYIIYFSSLKTIIKDNWKDLGRKFELIGITKGKFGMYMDDLNAGRNDADHYDAEDFTKYPLDWDISDDVIQSFMVALNNMNRFFDLF